MTKIVGPSGPKNARIAIVGEAPGEREVASGKPFVGPSGRLLDALLLKAGLSRENIYITNVVKERPPANDIGHFIKFKAGFAERTSAYNSYEEDLIGELNQVDPTVIVPMGKTAFYAVSGIVCGGKDGITKRRGSVYASKKPGLKGKKVIPTVHPAYVLRGNFADSYTLIHDLIRIREQSRFEEVRSTERSLLIPKAFDEAVDFFYHCISAESVGFDIEVVNEEVFCFALGLSSKEVMTFPLVTEEGADYWTPEQERVLWENLAFLLNKGPQLVLQNCMFDLTFMLRKMGMATRWERADGTTRIHDTMIAQAILTPDLPKGLDYIASIYTNEPYYKDEGKTHSKFGADWEQFLLYNAKDVAVTMEAFDGLKRDLEYQKNWPTYLKRMALLPALTFIQEHGIRLDRPAMERYHGEVVEELATMEREAQQVVADARMSLVHGASDIKTIDGIGNGINIRSPKQLANFFYKELGNKPYVDKGTGKPTTNQIALEKLTVKEVPAAKLVADHRLLDKQRGTYLEVELDEDKRLRGSMNPVGTSEGRISSSTSIFGTGTNMQNQPKFMKRFMLADPGFALYEVDLSMAENRLVALLSGDEAMLGAFQRNEDLHCLTASEIFDCKPSEVSREKGSSGHGTMSQRDEGKRANHGFNYDLGYKTFALKNRMKEAPAKKIHAAYHRIYWGLRPWHASIQKQLWSGRTLTNLFGRRRWFQGSLSGDTFRQAYAFIPASTVGDHTLNVVEEIYRDQETFGDVRLVNTVHDSIWFQIPLSRSWSYHVSVLNKIKSLLSVPFRFEDRWLSIPIDAHVGDSMGSLVEFDPKDKDPFALLSAWKQSELPQARKGPVSA